MLPTGSETGNRNLDIKGSSGCGTVRLKPTGCKAFNSSTISFLPNGACLPDAGYVKKDGMQFHFKNKRKGSALCPDSSLFWNYVLKVTTWSHWVGSQDEGTALKQGSV